MISRICFALALATPLTACTDSSLEDELDVDDAEEGDASKADAPGGTYTYYFLKPDLRRCASPYCGGIFYRLANADQTRCLDGKKADQCYAASEDWTKLGLGEVGMTKMWDALNKSAFSGEGSLLVRATIGSKNWGSGLGNFAVLNPTEAWISQGPGPAAGPLAKINDSGIRCITYPCFSLTERKLNSAIRANIAELGWAKSGATEEQVGKAYEQMNTEGLIVSGYRYTVTGPAGQGKARSVTQFWQRATDEAAAPTACFKGGCSGQVCSDRPDVITTCEFRPEYACYHSATCEAQADGTCGWTETPELQACLANPPN